MTNGPAATFAPSRHVLHCDTCEKKMSDKIKQKKEDKKESLENEKGVSRVKWERCALKGWSMRGAVGEWGAVMSFLAEIKLQLVNV